MTLFFRHHSAPIPKPITEETMEMEQSVMSTVPMQESLEPGNKPMALALIEEKSPSRERSKTPVVAEDPPKESVPSKAVPKEPREVPKAKKVKDRALSLDSELSGQVADSKPPERRRSKIFETAEKFSQLASPVEDLQKPKIFIPGVNVGGVKRAFERKASLSMPPPAPQTSKPNATKVIIDVPSGKKADKGDEVSREEEKKRAVDIISGAIGKPPVQRKVNGSPPTSPSTADPKKLGLKIPVGPNDFRSATVSVSTPVETKFPFEGKPALQAKTVVRNNIQWRSHQLVLDSMSRLPQVPSTPESASPSTSLPEEPLQSSKMEITLKSATLPRPRKTSKAEITLSRPPEAFKSEVEAKIDAFRPTTLRTQRSEVAFPVAAVVPPTNRSASLEPEGEVHRVPPKERIIPIHVGAVKVDESPEKSIKRYRITGGK